MGQPEDIRSQIFDWYIHPGDDSLVINMFSDPQQAPDIALNMFIIGEDSVTGDYRVKIYKEDINSSPIAGDLNFNGTKDGTISEATAIIVYTPPTPPLQTGSSDTRIFAGSWFLPCFGTIDTGFFQSGITLDNTGTFVYSFNVYPDPECTEIPTSQELHVGALTVGNDIPLAGGTTGSAVDVHITSTNGEPDNSYIYSIFQLDPNNVDILKTEGFYTSATARDEDNTGYLLLPYTRQ